MVNREATMWMVLRMLHNDGTDESSISTGECKEACHEASVCIMQQYTETIGNNHVHSVTVNDTMKRTTLHHSFSTHQGSRWSGICGDMHDQEGDTHNIIPCHLTMPDT